MAAKKLSSSIDGKDNPIAEEFDNISEDKLKSLLDEALDYKSPADAIDKSDMFQRLLKSANEEEERDNLFYELNGFGMKQSNSLQNLRDECYPQLNSNQTYSSSKKHHRRKNTTSVSTRRLEGGSLPVDMHHSSTDQPFLSEYKNSKKRKEKQKETVIDIGDYETDDKKLMQRSFDSTMKDCISSSYPNDGIEMKSLSYTNSVDLEVQDQSKYPSSAPQKIATISSMRNSDGGIPLINTKTIHAELQGPSAIDKTIQFSTLEKPTFIEQQYKLYEYPSNGSTINHANNIVVANPGCNYSVATPIQLGSSYPSVTSVANEKISSQKSYINKGETQPLITRPNPSIEKAYELNQKLGMPSMNSKEKGKKRPTKEDRSFASIRQAKDIDGYRGDKDVDELLKYIEDGDGDAKNRKSNSKHGILSNDFLSADDKKKKMTLKNKEKVNKLKKSNSCDELCSTGRQKQQEEKEQSSSSTTANENFNEEVTLRSKSGNLTSGAKKGDNKSDQSQSKRNERRSWGTEGLRTESTNNEQQEIDSSSSSCSNQSEAHIESLSAGEQSQLTDEFQTVIKKRKVKRKSSEAGDVPKTNSNIQAYKRDGKFTEGNARPGLRHPSDRENKNSKSGKSYNQESKASKSRRKSTSSMPPSEDEYNSDGNDSVQSLPIETTKSTSSPLFERKRDSKQNQTSQKQNKPATFSYADIAKTSTNRHNNGGSNSNGGMTPSIDKWPSITSSSVSSSHQNNTNSINNDPFSISNSEAAKSQPQQQQQQVQKSSASSATLVKKLSYPELVESNNNKNKQMSSVQQQSSDTNTNGERVMKPINGVESFDSNNNTDNQKISYSQSLLDNSAEATDANGNSLVCSKIEILRHQPTLTKSKSVDHNNFSSIEQYPALEKVPTTATATTATNKLDKINKTVALKQQQPPVKMVEMVKQQQPKKLKKSISQQQQVTSNSNVTSSSTTWTTASGPVAGNCRPAVIILNDCAKPNEVDCGITFGFDINEHLLFGHQNGDSSANDQRTKSTCTNDISLETNNNNTCDITNTNLSNNNLNNQIASAESYENLPQTKHIYESHTLSDQSSSSLLSPNQQKQQQLNNVLDISTQSSNNDHGYLSSSLITNSTSPPNLPAANNNAKLLSDDRAISETFKSCSSEEIKSFQVKTDIVLPHFLSPQPANFNHDEIVSFVIKEWTNIVRNGNIFKPQ